MLDAELRDAIRRGDDQRVSIERLRKGEILWREPLSVLELYEIKLKVYKTPSLAYIPEMRFVGYTRGDKWVESQYLQSIERLTYLKEVNVVAMGILIHRKVVDLVLDPGNTLNFTYRLDI